jgi:hypothetical protein
MLAVWHGFVDAQPAPAVHATHAPAPEHTMPLPHAVPAGAFPRSVHTGTPLVHAIAAAWHGFVDAHAAPLEHATHAPAPLHTPPGHAAPAGALPPAMHTGAPVAQPIAPVVHGLPVAHAVPAALETHAPDPLHAPPAQGVPAGALPLATHVPPGHVRAPRVHGLPVEHAAPVVQALQVPAGVHVPPGQLAEFGVCVQPVARAHASSVHGLPSSHTTVAPWHAPALQWSLLVHASPSSHGFVLSAWTHAPATHASSVHGLPSSHVAGHPVGASAEASVDASRLASSASSVGASVAVSVAASVATGASTGVPASCSKRSCPVFSPHAARSVAIAGIHHTGLAPIVRCLLGGSRDSTGPHRVVRSTTRSSSIHPARGAARSRDARVRARDRRRAARARHVGSVEGSRRRARRGVTHRAAGSPVG